MLRYLFVLVGFVAALPGAAAHGESGFSRRFGGWDVALFQSGCWAVDRSISGGSEHAPLMTLLFRVEAADSAVRLMANFWPGAFEQDSMVTVTLGYAGRLETRTALAQESFSLLLGEGFADDELQDLASAEAVSVAVQDSDVSMIIANAAWAEALETLELCRAAMAD